MLVYFFPDTSELCMEGWLGPHCLKAQDECCTSSLSVFGCWCLLMFFLRWLSITINISKDFSKDPRKRTKKTNKLLLSVSSCLTHCINLVPDYDLSVGSPTSRSFFSHEIYERSAARARSHSIWPFSSKKKKLQRQ